MIDHETGLRRFSFTSKGRTAIMNTDGTGLTMLDFDVPNQTTWQPCGFFSDGRMLLLSMETREYGPDHPFEEFYHKTPTHLWIHDLARGSLEEIATRDRMAPFITPQLILSDERLLVQVIRDKVAQTFSINLDGTDAREVTQPDEGMPYGLSVRPDGHRLAFHLAGPSGYQIWTSDVDGGHRALVAANRDLLFFGPSWSPDGEWLIYQGCQYRQDPGHDWSDLYISRPDGSQQRRLTTGQALWFAASYGVPGNRGGGSNMPNWTGDGRILASRRLPDSAVPWQYQTGRPDTDHFNREFRPEQATGGSQICRFAPGDGSVAPLTQPGPSVWDFRQTESADGQQLLFCRAEIGAPPAIWIAARDGRHQNLLTRGIEDHGADFPRWVP